MNRLDLSEPYDDDVTIYTGESEKIRPFFIAAFRDRLPWYIITLLAGIIISFLIGNGKSNVILFQIFALLLDIIGAVILGFGLIRSEVGIERDSTTVATNTAEGSFNITEKTGDGEGMRTKLDPLSVSSEARDTVDALAGILFLTSGFILQIFVVL